MTQAISTFSVTEMQSFLRSRRSAWLGSFSGRALTSAMPAPALNMGSIWHKATELWACAQEDMLTDKLLEPYPNARLGECENNALSDWVTIVCNHNEVVVNDNMKQIREFGLDSTELSSLWEQADLLRAMAGNYEAKYGRAIPPEYKLIQTEQTVVVPIPGTEHCTQCGSTDLYHPTDQLTWCLPCYGVYSLNDLVPPHVELLKLEATLDGLLQHVESGRPAIHEKKTYNARPKEAALTRGFQFISYIWVVRQLGFGHATVAYDGIWKREKPSARNTFDDLFLRFPIERSPVEVEQHGKYIAFIAKHMYEAYTAGLTDPATPLLQCNYDTCWTCWGVPCELLDRGEVAQFEDYCANNYITRDKGDREQVWNND